MGNKIEWCDETWNPIAGCSIVSPACTNCYAMAQAARIERMGEPDHYVGLTEMVKGKPVWTGKIGVASDQKFTEPLRWKKPRRIFVNSMSDLFHPNVADETIDRVFAVMALAPQHTFMVLTKRPERMREYIASRSLPDADWNAAEDVRVAMTTLVGTPSRRDMAPALKAIPLGKFCKSIAWPLTNAWLGVTAEDQTRADERREAMRALAAMGWRVFVSYEPALGPVDFKGWEFVSQIIVGGESGPHARPMPTDWARTTLAFCRAHGVAYFHKQNGEFRHCNDVKYDRVAVSIHDGSWFPVARGERPRQFNLLDRAIMRRVGKKRAGRLLDGVEYSEFPETRA